MLNINGPNHTGLNAMGIAVTTSNKQALDILLRVRANIEKCGIEGLSPLGLAAREGRLDMVNATLANGANVNGPGEESGLPEVVQAALLSPLRLALRHKHPEVKCSFGLRDEGLTLLDPTPYIGDRQVIKDEG